jgi:hypothetical protein
MFNLSHTASSKFIVYLKSGLKSSRRIFVTCYWTDGRPIYIIERENNKFVIPPPPHPTPA